MVHGPQCTGDRRSRMELALCQVDCQKGSPRTERTVGLPTYEYTCDHCNKNFDVVQSFHDDPLTSCPTCGSPVRKVFGNVGIVFKGSGFYKTDSRNGGPKKKDGDTLDPGRRPHRRVRARAATARSRPSPVTLPAKEQKQSTATPSKPAAKKSASGTPAGAGKSTRT